MANSASPSTVRYGINNTCELHMKYPVECICGNKEYKKILSGCYNRIAVRNFYFEILECLICGLKRVYPIPDADRAQDVATTYIKKIEKISSWPQGIVEGAIKLCQGSNRGLFWCSKGANLE